MQPAVHPNIQFPVAIGNQLPLVVIGGINVLESLDLALEVGEMFQTACQQLGLGFIFKASFDKANRTSANSYRGFLGQKRPQTSVFVSCTNSGQSYLKISPPSLQAVRKHPKSTIL